MVIGLDKFREQFAGEEDKYIIIGGTACDINLRDTMTEPRDTVDIDIIITTLWAKINLTEAYYTEQVISDFRRILYNREILGFADFNREHERCLSFLKRAVSSSDAAKIIVVSHHVPSFQMQNPKFANSKANGAFTVELEDYIMDSGIDYWIFGHSHYNVDVQIGKTRCVSNQLGYVSHGEHETFNYGKYIVA